MSDSASILRDLVAALPRCTGPFTVESDRLLAVIVHHDFVAPPCERAALQFLVNGADTSDGACDACAALVGEAPHGWCDLPYAAALRAAIAHLASLDDSR